MSDQPKITWRPASARVQILSRCVDCGRGVWWTRRELTITIPAGQDVTYRLLTTADPAYPATDEPRCYECTVYRALPWWRRLFTKRPRCIHDYERIGYGGAGWWAYQCRHCGEREIDHG